MNRMLLVVCVLVGTMFGQRPPKTPASTPLKEYSYPSDGFGIKFPYAPEPHLDSVHPDLKVWTIHLSQRASISVRLKVDADLPCDIALQKLKGSSSTESGNSQPVGTSLIVPLWLRCQL